MKEAPEGLDYGHDGEKYAQTPINDDWKEKGKLKTGECKPVSIAEELRMSGHGSHDPYYADSKKNR